MAGCGMAADVLSMVNAPPAQQIMNSAELVKLQKKRQLQILGEEVTLRNSRPRQPRNGSRDRRQNKKSMALATDAHARRHLELSRRTEGTAISNSACDMGVDSACVNILSDLLVGMWKGDNSTEAVQRVRALLGQASGGKHQRSSQRSHARCMFRRL